ncbi:hypothetical protein [Cryptosporangium aurantiacum]|uniref:Uncharacterized protein n=1 Tax=Cryptosporangium aurantiacum TaxID=134849 RepID=A0A1M7L7A1_9ACTN|nr:hypothetical protein [Cryptosporangium aurantiacum]SHM73240.1 hypothetical protein SAMN05443668_1011364 [Cryptosporangium aurantiacum]
MNRRGDVVAPVTDTGGVQPSDNEVRAVLRLLAEPANAGVLLHGVDRAARRGLAAAVRRSLGDRVEIVVTVDGPTDADEVLEAAADALEDAARAAGHPDAHPWHALAVPLRNRGHRWTERFQLLAVHVLPHWPVLFLFQDAETDLTTGGVFHDPDLGALVAAWVHEPGRGRTLFTSASLIALPTNPHRPLRAHHVGAAVG